MWFNYFKKIWKISSTFSIFFYLNFSIFNRERHNTAKQIHRLDWVIITFVLNWFQLKQKRKIEREIPHRFFAATFKKKNYSQYESNKKKSLHINQLKLILHGNKLKLRKTKIYLFFCNRKFEKFLQSLTIQCIVVEKLNETHFSIVSLENRDTFSHYLSLSLSFLWGKFGKLFSFL